MKTPKNHRKRTESTEDFKLRLRGQMRNMMICPRCHVPIRKDEGAAYCERCTGLFYDDTVVKPCVRTPKDRGYHRPALKPLKPSDPYYDPLIDSPVPIYGEDEDSPKAMGWISRKGQP
jgi:hypothetical protein